ncbi:MAG: hypothetical protein IT550_02640 [Novosphingobium sp.]|nr:hypothetical protein [Novosphingobium sp.]
MKANHGVRFSWLLAATLLPLLATACSDRRVIPAPTPTPTLRPAPTTQPPPPAPRPAADWRDAPITPGDWRWSIEGGQSVARFAGGALVLRCSQGKIAIERAGGSGNGADVPMTITTTSTGRPVMARAQSTPAVIAVLDARDPLLDAMAFSRGRFAVDVAGLAPLYVPSWPEVSRVIQDCR